MIVADLPLQAVRQRLYQDGLPIATGPFNCRIRTNVSEIVPDLAKLYSQNRVLPETEFFDFRIEVVSTGLRRWIRPQARFLVDEVEPFRPLPRSQALPMLEWGLNWCITAYSHHVLVVHAATVARDGHALILPAPPGSGKSTLCAALVNRGWRLLSDELTVIRLDGSEVLGLARPVNLKNASIDIVGRFAPEAFLTRPIFDTTKGTVALMAAPPASVHDVSRSVAPRWVILPRYVPGADTSLTPMSSGEAFLEIAGNAMNYHILGLKGFEAVSEVVDRCKHYRLEYSQLDDVIAELDSLADRAGP